MLFINELNRYFFLNVSKPKKSLLPLLLNVSIVVVFYNFFRDYITIDYVFAYLMVWLFFSLHSFLSKDLQGEIKNGHIKYYFSESFCRFINVYFCRYILCLIKNLCMIIIIIYVLNLLGLIENHLSIYDYTCLFVGFSSLFGMFFILTLLENRYHHLKLAMNFLLVGSYFFLLINKSQLVPLGGVINNVAMRFLEYSMEKVNLMYLLANGTCYLLIGYVMATFLIYILKTEILK